MPRLASLLIAAMLALSPALTWAAGWALGGMDAVAYHHAGDAVPGQAMIATRWDGQEWHFSTEENRAEFEANPRAFAPGLEGYCPVALAQGRVTAGNPRFFVVMGQRLYLFHSAQARQQFLADPRKILMAAKAAFVKLAR